MKNRKLFGFDVYTGDSKELISYIKNCKGKVHIISGNAEVLKYPLKSDVKMRQFLDSKNIIIPDGVSVSIPLKRKYKEDIKRLTGIDLMKEILKESEKEGKTVYFLGSKETVLKDMILNISNAYPKLVIKGSHHGYIDTNKCEQLIDELKNANPDVLFVAMGTPIQEDFIFKYIDILPCKVYMGVGGSFDVISGKVKRCPKWISSLGIEWLYRMFKDPKKIKRLWNNIFFTLKGLVKG